MGLSVLQAAVWEQGASRVVVPGLGRDEVLAKIRRQTGIETFRWIAELPPEQRSAVLQIKKAGAIEVAARLAKLTGAQQEAFDSDWRTIGRPEQFAPEGNWRTWVIRAGRGYGKTMAGAQFVREKVESGAWKRPYLVGATAADVRDVMIEGPSGILAISPRHWRPRYEPSKRRLTWPNGVRAILRSAEKPDRMRGPQGDGAWLDELAAWKYPREAWDQLSLSLRLGTNPQVCITTTPRPIEVLKEILADHFTVQTFGSTYDNLDNLAASYIDSIFRKYAGTRLGLQEIEAALLEDNPNALWKLIDISAKRIGWEEFLARHKANITDVATSVDPATTTNPNSNETGIVTGAAGWCDCQGKPARHGYVFDDNSGQLTPKEWALAAGQAAKTHRTNIIVGETNQGGDLVLANLQANAETRGLVFIGVHAKDGKRLRAEPVASLYEQRIVHHVGTFGLLESQMTQWNPKDISANGGESPDRLDALVHLLTHLLVGPSMPEFRKRKGEGFKTRR